MHKMWIIARREYRAIVGTKAFVIAITLMPILMFGGIAVQKMLEGRVGPTEKRILVVDGTGVLFDALAKAAQQRNEHAITDLETGKQIHPRYVLTDGSKTPLTEQSRYELSEKVRHREIDAFVEIPAEVLKMPDGNPARVGFYAENAIVADEKGWFQGTLSEMVRSRRLRQAGIEPKLVDLASAPVMVEPMGLVQRTQSGQVTKPQQATVNEAIFVPFGIMMLMWMVIFLAAQPMMESVIEEKGQRIAEVLLGSVSPFQLMAGKLLGGVAGSLTVVAIYGVGGLVLAWYYDSLQLVPLRVIPWFLVYQVLAVMIFGSIFMAVGAAVNQLKEAQSMLLPIWLLMASPFFVWLQVIRDPVGNLATWMSFFPPATPMMMVLRVGASTAVPWWQPALGILVLLATTFVGVLAAARIFRIGFLAQGKSPKMVELLRWALRG